MKRASYREAILWMAHNDDNEWVEKDDPVSVTAALIADLFDVEQEKVKADLIRQLEKMWKESRKDFPNG